MKWQNGSALFTVWLIGSTSFAAEVFRVAAYNVENYLDQPTESRHFVKSAEARAKIRESIRAQSQGTRRGTWLWSNHGTTRRTMSLCRRTWWWA